MAIIRGTFATKLTGRVGNVVYRITDGKNIASERPASVKNPRTQGQQEQRMRMATIVAAYSSMKGICDHSFEGKTYGAKNMNEFMRLNLNLAKDWDSNFNIKGNPSVVANPYQISKGSLGSLDAVSVADNGVALVATTANLADMTVAQFFALFGLQVGDQLTILAMIPTKGEASFASYVQKYNAVYYRRVIAKIGTDTEKMFNGSSLNSEVLDDTAIVNNLTFAVSGNNLVATFEGVDTIVAGGIIGSAKKNQKWERTTSYMVVNESADVYPGAAIVESYNVGDDYYLNNGEAVAGAIVEPDDDNQGTSPTPPTGGGSGNDDGQGGGGSQGGGTGGGGGQEPPVSGEE